MQPDITNRESMENIDDLSFMNHLLENDPYWQLGSATEAERMCRGLQYREARLDDYIRICQDNIEFYKQRIEDARAAHERATGWAKNQLEHYLRTNNPRRTKTGQQIIDLPTAKLALKPQQPTYIRDDSKTIEWALTSAPQYIQIKHELDWKKLKTAIAPTSGEQAIVSGTGEMIPGVTIARRPPAFTIQFLTKLNENQPSTQLIESEAC